MLLNGVKYDKNFGKSLDVCTFKEALYNFCQNNDEVVFKILSNLKTLKKWFLEENRSYRFIASSLLIGYDGEHFVFKMIDFCHVESIHCTHEMCELGDCVDLNYLKGVDGLIGVFESISMAL